MELQKRRLGVRREWRTKNWGGSWLTNTGAEAVLSPSAISQEAAPAEGQRASTAS